MTNKWKTLVGVFVLFVNAAVSAHSAENATKAENPAAAKPPKITVSEETTRFIEPLREDGSLDCVRLLNEIAGKDVTPENNGAVLVWQAIGPKEIPREHREKFFKLLGVPTLPDEGEYLVTLDDFVMQKRNGKLVEEDYDRISDSLDEAMKRPWSEDEFPELAELLAKNEQPLALFLKAAERPRFHSPVVVTGDEILSAVDSSLVSPFREVAKLLVARAMLNVKKGREAETWKDLIGGYRLGRLRRKGRS